MEAGNAERPENQSGSAADYSRRAGIELFSDSFTLPSSVRDGIKEALTKSML
jgi:hypothetical protein